MRYAIGDIVQITASDDSPEAAAEDCRARVVDNHHGVYDLEILENPDPSYIHDFYNDVPQSHLEIA